MAYHQLRNSRVGNSVLHWTPYGPNNSNTQTKRKEIHFHLFAKNYRSGQKKWTSGTMMYNLVINSEARYKNQKHPRYTENDITGQLFHLIYWLTLLNCHLFQLPFMKKSMRIIRDLRDIGKIVIALGWEAIKLILGMRDTSKYLNREV